MNQERLKKDIALRVQTLTRIAIEEAFKSGKPVSIEIEIVGELSNVKIKIGGGK